MKAFLISIDTEGDNLWTWKRGEGVTSENAKYLNRFQMLCDKYGFKPTYLTNWEMVQDDYYVDWVGKIQAENRCEVGMHLHAWNTPPLIDLSDYDAGGNDYLIEYGISDMEAKIVQMDRAIFEKIGIKPITHRAGRWAMDQRYFNLLAKHGYVCDCSVTPGIDWSAMVGASSGSMGSNYRDASSEVYEVRCGDAGSIIEVPLTTIPSPGFIPPSCIGIKPLLRQIRRWSRHDVLQLRPNLANFNELKSLVEFCSSAEKDYLMFMLHSSEFMPGGSPTFRTEKDIECLYKYLEGLFDLISQSWCGMTIGDFAKSEVNKQGSVEKRND